MSVAEARSAAARREERKAQNRAKLLAAARKVFAEKGLGAATARDIVRETDLASGTFYNYFEDKEHVFRTLLQEISDKARARVIEQRREPGRTLEQRVEGAYLTYFQLAVEEREMFEVFRRNAGVIAMSPEEGMLEAAMGELMEDLREWAAAGELPDVDLVYLGAAMVGVAVQIAGELIERDPPDAAEAARFCTVLTLQGARALEQQD